MFGRTCEKLMPLLSERCRTENGLRDCYLVSNDTTLPCACLAKKAVWMWMLE